MDATKYNDSLFNKDPLWTEARAAAAGAEFDIMLAPDAACLAEMIREKSVEAFAAHPYTMGSPGCVGVFHGTIGYGDHTVLSTLAVEEQSEELLETYPTGATFAYTIPRAEKYGLPIKSMSTRMEKALLRIGAIELRDDRELAARAAARHTVAVEPPPSRAVAPGGGVGGSPLSALAPASPAGLALSAPALGRANSFGARGALTPRTPLAATPEGDGGAAETNDAVPDVAVGREGDVPEQSMVANERALLAAMAAVPEVGAIPARTAAFSVPGANIDDFRQERTSHIKEGRESAYVAELRRNTKSLLTRFQSLAPRFVELVANGARSQLVGLDELSPVALAVKRGFTRGRVTP